MSMLVLKNIVDIPFTIAEGLLMVWVFRILLTPKKEMKFFGIKNISAVLIMLILINLTMLVPDHLETTVNWIVTFTVPCVYAILFYKGSVLKKLIVVAAYEIVTTIIGQGFVVFWMLLGYSFDDMHQFGIQYVSTMFAVHASYYIATIPLAKVVKKGSMNLKKLETILIAIMMVVSFLFYTSTAQIVYLVNSVQIRVFLLTANFLLIFISIITFYILNKISKQNNIERENALLKLEQEYQKKQYEDIIIQSEQIRKLRHDYKNNFLVIRSLIEDNNDTKAIEIIDKDLEHINASKSHIKTNNDIVNAIVNTKMSEAFSHGIKVEFKSISDFDELDDFDLCNLISNMFDNAITAVKNCDTKLIDIIISKKNNYYIIKMSNTIPQSVLDKNPELNTTKQDKTSHGYGIKIIKDIAKKYSGEFDCYEDDGMFYSLVYLAPMSINKEKLTV